MSCFGQFSKNIILVKKYFIFRLGQIRLGQVRAGQGRLGQVKLGQARLGQVRLGQVRLGQLSLGQVRLGQVRLGQVRFEALCSLTCIADKNETFQILSSCRNSSSLPPLVYSYEKISKSELVTLFQQNLATILLFLKKFFLEIQLLHTVHIGSETPGIVFNKLLLGGNWA